MAIRTHSGSIFGLEAVQDEEPPIPVAIVTDQPCPAGYVRKGDACYSPEGLPQSGEGFPWLPLAAFFIGRMVAGNLTGLAAAVGTWWLVNRSEGA